MVFFQPGSLSSRAHLGFSSLRTCLDKNIEESYHPQKTSRFPCASQELKISLFSPYFSKKTLSACISLWSCILLCSPLPFPPQASMPWGLSLFQGRAVVHWQALQKMLLGGKASQEPLRGRTIPVQPTSSDYFPRTAGDMKGWKWED